MKSETSKRIIECKSKAPKFPPNFYYLHLLLTLFALIFKKIKINLNYLIFRIVKKLILLMQIF